MNIFKNFKSEEVHVESDACDEKNQTDLLSDKLAVVIFLFHLLLIFLDEEMIFLFLLFVEIHGESYATRENEAEEFLSTEGNCLN